MTAPIIDEEYPLGKDDEDWIYLPAGLYIITAPGRKSLKLAL